MFRKIKVVAGAVLFSAILATPAAAFPDFNFGMNNRGPYMKFNNGPNFWLFNMDNPFGRYGSAYNRGYGYNGYRQQPWNRFYGGRNRFNQWPQQFPARWPNQWNRGSTPWSGGSPWSSGMRPWGGSPWGGSPFGGSPFRGSPFGGSPFGGSPFNGFSPF